MATAPSSKGRHTVVPIRSTMTGLAEPTLVFDRISFRSPSEVAVYKALLAAADDLPEYRGLGVFPNATGRVGAHTWEVDFLVTHGGRCGAIEVDGEHHRGRWLADRSRDRLLEDVGVHYVDRIDAQDALIDSEVTVFVRRFLDRLRT